METSSIDSTPLDGQESIYKVFSKPDGLPMGATVVSRTESFETLGAKCAGRTFQAAQDRMSCEAGPVKTARR
jgi:hypothetical protein